MDEVVRVTLDEVIRLVEYHSGLQGLRGDTAVDQDMRISGDDVIEFAEALAERFGKRVWDWPWQRFAELSEPHLFTSFRLFWRLLTWPFRGYVLEPSPFERLELGHIDRAVDAGHWIEP